MARTQWRGPTASFDAGDASNDAKDLDHDSSIDEQGVRGTVRCRGSDANLIALFGLKLQSSNDSDAGFRDHVRADVEGLHLTRFAANNNGSLFRLDDGPDFVNEGPRSEIPQANRNAIDAASEVVDDDVGPSLCHGIHRDHAASQLLVE